MHNDLELQPIAGPSRIPHVYAESQESMRGHSYNHNDIRDHARVHFEGTIGLFFEDARFVEWSDGLEGLTPRILWCRGTIGAGKTVLAGQILNRKF